MCDRKKLDIVHIPELHPYYYDPVCSNFLFVMTLLITNELQKSNLNDPKWFMEDLRFTYRAIHFIPLAMESDHSG